MWKLQLINNNFEISLVVFMPKITTNHTITNTYLAARLEGIKQKKSSWGSILNNTFLLFYSPKPRNVSGLHSLGQISAMNEKNDIILHLISRLDFIYLYTNFNCQGRYIDGKLPKCLNVRRGSRVKCRILSFKFPNPTWKWITTKQKRQSNFFPPIFRRVKPSIYREFHEETEEKSFTMLFLNNDFLNSEYIRRHSVQNGKVT